VNFSNKLFTGLMPIMLPQSATLDFLHCLPYIKSFSISQENAGAAPGFQS